jgi:hypothetical protein
MCWTTSHNRRLENDENLWNLYETGGPKTKEQKAKVQEKGL